MTIDATFWVAIAFFIFFGGLIYLKVPQKINAGVLILPCGVIITPVLALD